MRARVVVAASIAGLVACGTNDLQPIVAADDGSAVTGDDGGTPADSAPVDGGALGCKRGIASSLAPSSAFLPAPSSPGISWWYNWSNQPPPSGGAGIEFVPMIWGGAALNDPIPGGSRFVLGFNEPNFKSQANLTPQQAAADWPKVEALAKAAGIPIVSPALNYCGTSSSSTGCTDPTVYDPYTYLQDFFAACPGCQVDAIAVHWYACDLASLRGYLEGNVDAGGGLKGFVQFKKPIWLTEFSCDSSASVAQQKTYMQAAVPYLESNPHVYRYSWYNANGIPNALLQNPDGSLTDLGKTYVTLSQNCP